ncbi:hypothetical protein TNCV_3116901 [Trichonephila clavipes]|nr:hypothetical protein TNCV_3116901 [Trichonephila clavipes]
MQRLQKKTNSNILVAVPSSDSKAARLVSSFPPTKNNYLKAITQLKERFGRDELLVQIYVRDFCSPS